MTTTITPTAEKLVFVPAMARHQHPAFSSWHTGHYSDEGQCEILAHYEWSGSDGLSGGGGLIVRHQGVAKLGYLSVGTPEMTPDHEGRYVVVIGKTFGGLPDSDNLIPVVLSIREGRGKTVRRMRLHRYPHPTAGNKVVIGTV